MRKKRFVMTALIVGIAAVFFAGTLYATDVIKMQTKGYDKHTNPIVEFHHKSHAQDYAKKYPDLYKDGCGACHHDANHKPLTSLKEGDKVESCIACHKEPGKKPSKEKLSKKERIKKYHAEAIHENCQGCHRDHNKANKLKSKDPGYAPTTCNKCHKK